MHGTSPFILHRILKYLMEKLLPGEYAAFIMILVLQTKLQQWPLISVNIYNISPQYTMKKWQTHGSANVCYMASKSEAIQQSPHPK